MHQIVSTFGYGISMYLIIHETNNECCLSLFISQLATL